MHPIPLEYTVAIALERSPAQPRPWLTASRILLVATAELLVHGMSGFGRPVRLDRRSGRRVTR